MDFRRRRMQSNFPFDPMKNKKAVVFSFLLWTSVIFYIYHKLVPKEDGQVINKVKINEGEPALSLSSDVDVKRSKDGRIMKITSLKHKEELSRIRMVMKETDDRRMINSDKPVHYMKNDNVVGKSHEGGRGDTKLSGGMTAKENTLQKTSDVTEKFHVIDLAKDWFAKPRSSPTSVTKDNSKLLNLPLILDHLSVLNSIKKIFKFSKVVSTINLNITKDVVNKTTISPKTSELEKILKERAGFTRVSSIDANDSISLCDCPDKTGHCVCCSQITVSYFGINKTSCVNVYFNQTLLTFDVQLIVDKKLILQKMFRAKQMAQLCVVDSNQVDMCLVFKNFTYTVTVVEGYNRIKNIRGCVFSYLQVLKRTVGVFPSRCFRMNFKS